MGEYGIVRVVKAVSDWVLLAGLYDGRNKCLGQYVSQMNGTDKMPSILERYVAGESKSVWADLVALGSEVRSPAYFEDAFAVATQTMWRVRHNVEVVHERLQRMGYEFWVPDQVHVPPRPDTPAILAEIEHLRGPIPLSLQAFYEVVGSVDFRQSPRQLTHLQDVQRDSASELSMLGEEDPLVVAPVEELLRRARAIASTQAKRVEFTFAPDEFHKANYSGGENYHLWLPNASADFPIEGMYEINEYFVDYLRATFAWGGFRGRVEPREEDESRAQKVAPQLRLIDTLAHNLMKI